MHYVTKPAYAEILESNPCIDKVHVLTGSLSQLIRDLKYEHFNHIIDLHKNIRSNRIKKQLLLPAFTFQKLNYRKWLLVNFKINRMPDIHIVERYLKTIELFDTENDGQGLDYFIPEKDMVDIYSLPTVFRDGYAGFVIGAKHFTKQLPAEKIISICRKINYPVILLGGPEDRAKADIIAASGIQAYNACGNYSINQSASLVKQAKIIITHDTGMMHIAAALKKKIISIWGNTVPALGMYPYQPDPASEIIQAEGLKCRPCTKLGFRQCPKKHFKCMMEIDEERVARVAKGLLDFD